MRYFIFYYRLFEHYSKQWADNVHLILNFGQIKNNAKTLEPNIAIEPAIEPACKRTLLTFLHNVHCIHIKIWLKHTKKRCVHHSICFSCCLLNVKVFFRFVLLASTCIKINRHHIQKQLIPQLHRLLRQVSIIFGLIWVMRWNSKSIYQLIQCRWLWVIANNHELAHSVDLHVKLMSVNRMI